MENKLAYIKLPKNKNFLVVGSGDPVKTFIKALGKVYPKSKTLVLSDKKCDEAWSIYESESIANIANALSFSIKFVDDINTNQVLKTISDHNCNICFVLGSRWIFKERIINYFQGCIFNYHTSSLPKYRGGGGYRWQIMNKENYIYIAFHQLVKKIDAGPVLKEYKQKEESIFYPEDIFKYLHQFTKEKFHDFLKFINNEDHYLKIQDENESTYFPLLDNDINGAINLVWSKSEILSFIRAFSYPYKGAFIFYNHKKYYIKEAEARHSENKFHPFALGLIINSTDDFVEFVAKNGIIKVRMIENENSEPVSCSFFRPGNRFYTPEKCLIEAALYRPSNKSFILTVSRNNNG